MHLAASNGMISVLDYLISQAINALKYFLFWKLH